MPRLTLPNPAWIGLVAFVSAACLMGAACSGGGGGDASPSTGGTGSGGGASTGGQTCIAAATPRAAHSAQPNYDTVQPCVNCHPTTTYTGAYVYDLAGMPVAGATLTLTPTAAGSIPLTTISGVDGMFYFTGIIPAPYAICVSKCPDTLCGTAIDHPNANDCALCHGVTTTKIHLP
ncbi:MAG: carboxypeptidase regulatory-like domain-containing protein [Polyangiaceae bacterium]|nr:carboxypeptidase regulatory-like domain-containing protein [Polyangiaceae bacterium]